MGNGSLIQGGCISLNSNSLCGLLCRGLGRLSNYNEAKRAKEVGGHHHRGIMKRSMVEEVAMKVYLYIFLYKKTLGGLF